MSDSPEQPVKKKDGCGTALVVGIVALAALCGIGYIWGAVAGDKEAASGNDASARVACREFQALASDAAKGILAPDQLLPATRSIYDAASVSDNVAVRNAAQQMLAAVTADQDASAQIRLMASACSTVGQ
jgi:hypothetical protein